jgi:DNA-directed RNA polymerase sigma subunit (sigma70/sigma32)
VKPTPSERDEESLEEQARGARHLNDAEQAELLVSFKHGETAAGRRLLEANLEMVLAHARARRNRGLSVSELYQEGALGFVESLDGFDERGVEPFASYAARSVGAAMEAAIDGERAAEKEARAMATAAEDFEHAQRAVRARLGREATTAEIAVQLEWTVEKTATMAEIVAEARLAHDLELLQFVDPQELVGSDEEPKPEPKPEPGSM